MVINRWNKRKINPLLTEYFDKVENVTYEQIEEMTNEELGIDLSDKGINPHQLVCLLEEFGYEREDQDDNGWELDFGFTWKEQMASFFDSGCENLVVRGCGMTFELKIYIDDMDF